MSRIRTTGTITKIAEYNLQRDRRVLGQRWLSTYGGWFANEENIQSFIDALKPLLPNKELDILYVASASGLLGERLLEELGRGTLTLVDISQEHLDENKNPDTKKVKADLQQLDLRRQFDLVIMRSALDYFPTPSLQVEVLRVIKNHLKPEGLFVNQPAYISNIHNRDIISQVYNATDKIGKRLFQSSDIESLYSQAGFSAPQKIGDGKVMRISEKDHSERYDLTPADIRELQNILSKTTANGRVTKEGYELEFEFPIFVSSINHG